jgi:hypothetical protein
VRQFRRFIRSRRTNAQTEIARDIVQSKATAVRAFRVRNCA